ncbi:MAG: IS1595 family transposase, partial [Bacteroidota bacterium]
MAPTDATMTLNNLAKNFHDETRAREILEAIRWPNGVTCPRCGSQAIYKITVKAKSKTRPGVYRCRDCRKQKKADQFTATVGTIFEDSHIPLSKWLLAISLLCSSKKGMSAHQLHRMLGITYKSAWFMAHRIRYAMQAENLNLLTGIVEADETYIGGKARGVGSGNVENKTPVIALVQRNGEVRSFAIPTVSAQT